MKVKKVKKNKKVSLRHSHIYNGILLGFMICSLIGVSVFYMKPSFAYPTASISFDAKNREIINIGETITLKLKFSNVTDKKIVWGSSSNRNAVVNKNTGKITGMGAGEVKIYAYSPSTKIKKTYQLYVECRYRLVKGQYPENLKVGQVSSIKGILDCLKGNHQVTYISKNPSIVSVDKFGKLTAKKKGTAYIKVRVSNTNIEKIITIKVK